MTGKSTRKPRAQGRAPAMEVVAVKAMPAGQRVPKALVTVRIGAITITCSFARYRRGAWEVKYPVAPDGLEGVALPADMEAQLVEMVKAAAEADPAARARLMDRYW